MVLGRDPSIVLGWDPTGARMGPFPGAGMGPPQCRHRPRHASQLPAQSCTAGVLISAEAAI